MNSMKKNLPSVARQLSFPCLASCLALIIAGSAVGVCSARDHIDGFDETRPTWTLLYDRSAAGITRQVRSTDVRHKGQAAELIEVEVTAATTMMELAHQLPPARLIEDTSLSLWFQSTQDGARLNVRVVLPNQIDPDTGKN